VQGRSFAGFARPCQVGTTNNPVVTLHPSGVVLRRSSGYRAGSDVGVIHLVCRLGLQHPDGLFGFGHEVRLVLSMSARVAPRDAELPSGRTEPPQRVTIEDDGKYPLRVRLEPDRGEQTPLKAIEEVAHDVVLVGGCLPEVERGLTSGRRERDEVPPVWWTPPD
jgi:hypothetical protein